MKTQIQHFIENQVTNGLGYDSHKHPYRTYFGDSIERNSADGLERHLNHLDYEARSNGWESYKSLMEDVKKENEAFDERVRRRSAFFGGLYGLLFAGNAVLSSDLPISAKIAYCLPSVIAGAWSGAKLGGTKIGAKAFRCFEVPTLYALIGAVHAASGVSDAYRTVKRKIVTPISNWKKERDQIRAYRKEFEDAKKKGFNVTWDGKSQPVHILTGEFKIAFRPQREL